AEAADFPEVGMPRDADNENAEEQRRDDVFDEAQENGAEKLQADRDRGAIMAQLRAGETADESPSGQGTARSCVRGDDDDRQPAQDNRDQRGQREHVSAGEQRGGDGNRCGHGCRGEKFVFHRRSMKNFIGAERYAGWGRVSMATAAKKAATRPFLPAAGGRSKIRSRLKPAPSSN